MQEAPHARRVDRVQAARPASRRRRAGLAFGWIGPERRASSISPARSSRMSTSWTASSVTSCSAGRCQSTTSTRLAGPAGTKVARRARWSSSSQHDARGLDLARGRGGRATPAACGRAARSRACLVARSARPVPRATAARRRDRRRGRAPGSTREAGANVAEPTRARDGRGLTRTSTGRLDAEAVARRDAIRARSRRSASAAGPGRGSATASSSGSESFHAPANDLDEAQGSRGCVAAGHRPAARNRRARNPARSGDPGPRHRSRKSTNEAFVALSSPTIVVIGSSSISRCTRSAEPVDTHSGQCDDAGGGLGPRRRASPGSTRVFGRIQWCAAGAPCCVAGFGAVNDRRCVSCARAGRNGLALAGRVTMSRIHRFISEHVEPADRLCEMVFGLVMALGVTGAIRLGATHLRTASSS